MKSNCVFCDVCVGVCIDACPSNTTHEDPISAARATTAAPIYALHPPLTASKTVLSSLSMLVLCPQEPGVTVGLRRP